MVYLGAEYPQGLVFPPDANPVGSASPFWMREAGQRLAHPGSPLVSEVSVATQPVEANPQWDVGLSVSPPALGEHHAQCSPLGHAISRHHSHRQAFGVLHGAHTSAPLELWRMGQRPE